MIRGVEALCFQASMPEIWMLPEEEVVEIGCGDGSSGDYT